MWRLDKQSLAAAQAPLPEDTLEIPILLVGNESFEDAVRDVIAYLTDRCVRLGIRHIQFVCQQSGNSTEWAVTCHPTCSPA